MEKELEGVRVLITRELEKAEESAREIAGRGGIPIIFPTIATIPTPNLGPLIDAINNIKLYKWVVVTSQTGAIILVEKMREMGVFAPEVGFAVVGHRTAECLVSFGIKNILIPKQMDAKGLATTLIKEGVKDTRVLVIRAEKGREVLVDDLQRAGAIVEQVIAYQTVLVKPDTEKVKTLMEKGIDCAIFMSPSQVIGFFEALGHELAFKLLSQILIIAIGGTTKSALAEKGLCPHTPKKPSFSEAIDLVAELVRQQRQNQGYHHLPTTHTEQS